VRTATVLYKNACRAHDIVGADTAGRETGEKKGNQGNRGCAVRLLNTIRLSKDLEARLEQLARVTGHSKSYLLNQALEDHLQQLEGRLVSHRLPASDGRERVLPLYELERALGRDD
jgi:RHH-type transcriptional regulator, rel operon repressor / antitoxin RelB